MSFDFDSPNLDLHFNCFSHSPFGATKKTGNPLPNLTWYMNNRKLPSQSSIQLAVDETSGPLRTMALPPLSSHWYHRHHQQNRSSKMDKSNGKTMTAATSIPDPLNQANGNKSVISLLRLSHLSSSTIGSMLRCQAWSSAVNGESLLKPVMRLIKLDLNCEYWIDQVTLHPFWKGNHEMIFLFPFLAVPHSAPNQGHYQWTGPRSAGGRQDHSRDLHGMGRQADNASLLASRQSTTERCQVRPLLLAPCESLAWHIDLLPLCGPFRETSFQLNGTTRSVVRHVLSAQDNGRWLRCIATNPSMMQVGNKDPHRPHHGSQQPAHQDDRAQSKPSESPFNDGVNDINGSSSSSSLPPYASIDQNSSESSSKASSNALVFDQIQLNVKCECWKNGKFLGCKKIENFPLKMNSQLCVCSKKSSSPFFCFCGRKKSFCFFTRFPGRLTEEKLTKIS